MDIGSRVQVTGKDLVGILTFKGKVHFADGEFGGIVLDEQRGKNNGTVQGQKYFECEDGFGLMVPISKVQPATNGSGLAAGSRTTSELSLAASDRSSGESRGSAVGASKRAAGALISRPVTSSSTNSRSSVVPPSSRRITVAPSSTGNLVVPGSKMLAPTVPNPRTSATTLATNTPALQRLPTGRHSIAPTMHARDDAVLETPLQMAHASVRSDVVTEGSVSQPIKPSPTTQNEAAVLAAAAAEEIARLESEKADLASKLETLLAKRGEDKVKLRELEKLRLQYEQLEIHNKRLLENNKGLQLQLDETKLSLAEQAADLAEKSSSSVDESSRALLESLALDKEIAEERADQLKEENAQLTEQVKVLEEQLAAASSSVPLASLSPPLADGAGTPDDLQSRIWHLEDENAKFRNACTHLRDALAEEEALRIKQEEDALAARHELNLLNSLYAQVNQDFVQVRQENAELREQLDSAASAQDMAEKLIEKNLDLNTQLEDLNTQIEELTLLRDTNDELLEHAASKEKEYLAELSKRDAYISSLKLNCFNFEREQEDINQQMQRFSERFRQMEAENVELRQQIDMIVPDHQSAVQSSRHNIRLTSEQMIGQQRMRSKLVAANVSAQRQRVEHLTGALRYDYALAFMPDSFTKARESAYIDAVCTLIALIEKCALLEQQVTQNFHALRNQPAKMLLLDGTTTSSTDDTGVSTDAEESQQLHSISEIYHERDRACFAAYLLFVCECIRYVAQKISRRAHLATDMTPLVGFAAKLQKAGDDVDYYLKLLQNNHLDENVALDSLEQSFFTLLTEQRNLNFGDEPPISKNAVAESADSKSSDAEFLRSVLTLVNRAVLSMNISLDWLKELHDDVDGKDIDKRFFDVLRRLEGATSEIVNYVGACRRPLDTDAAVYVLKLPSDLTKRLDTRPTILLNAVRLLYRWVRTSSRASHAAANVDFSSFESHKKISSMDADKLFVKLREVNVSLGAAAFARAPEEEVFVLVQELAVSVREISQGLEKGKWFHGSFEAADGKDDKQQQISNDIMLMSPTKRVPQQSAVAADHLRTMSTQQYPILPALLRRADAFKKQLVDAEALRYEIDNKRQEITELQQQLRSRADEIDALKLRISTFEHKFETSSTSREGQLILLKRANDELEIKLKRREAEVESQHSIFMQSIKKLEQEKQTLEQHLRQAGKRFLAGGGSSRLSGGAGAAVGDISLLSEANGTVNGAGDISVDDIGSFNGVAVGPVGWTSYLTPAEETAAMHSIINKQSAELTLLRVKLADKLLMQLLPEKKNNNAAAAEKRWQAKADSMKRQINAARREYYELAQAIDFSVSAREMERQLYERDQRQAMIVQKLQQLKVDMQRLEVERKHISSGNFYMP